MVYQIATSRSTSSTSENRSFQLEVSGLHQNESTDRNNYAIRSSASVLLTVPYSRLSAELQRVNRLGGKVVSIQPLG
ncbi:MAG: phycobilisome linker polypeptide [Lyngbya sp. HA4199-MV5]|jgi:predicted dinucleotide-binding enzyme|nr:phycobilisome linker polypeptide [Lyngbya sp. HA4199-MV5]